MTATTDRAPELAKRWPNSFWLLGTSARDRERAGRGAQQAAQEGKIGANVAMISVADQFGIELSTAAREAFKKAGFKLVYDKSYPLGTQDMQPVLTEAMRSNADVFVAFSYPPDTLGDHRAGARARATIRRCSTPAVGTAFPLYKGGSAPTPRA